MDFGSALELLKEGSKLSREAWGDNEFIVLMPSLHLPAYNTQHTNRKVNDRTAKHIGEDTALDSQPYIAMFTHDKKWQPGWVATQSDILSDDWEVLES